MRQFRFQGAEIGQVLDQLGDGAGAVVLEASEEAGILSTHLHADGAYETLLHVPGGVSRGYEDVPDAERDPRYTHMKGNEVFKMAVNTLGRIVDETLDANHMKKSDIDWLVPHQANKRIIDATDEKMGIGPEKVMLNIHKYGNTTSGTIPLCLHDYEAQLHRGDHLVLAAFGAGFTWGAVYLQWAYDPI